MINNFFYDVHYYYASSVFEAQILIGLEFEVHSNV